MSKKFVISKQFLATITTLAILVVVWVWVEKTNRSTNPESRLTDNQEQICVQVITPARNPATGETRDFLTPCDMPEGWEAEQGEIIKINSNDNDFIE